jgi:threonine/homoserine/homoserine lactone efflux protein
MIVGLVAFVGVSLVVICTPGPDTALTVRNAFTGGRRSGVWTAAGVATGQIVWTFAASLGIAGIIKASEPVFFSMKMLGAGYLVYLGIQSLRAARRGGPTHEAAERGADGVVLGCTEIELLVRPEDSTVPALPTTRLHATAAVDWALR